MWRLLWTATGDGRSSATGPVCLGTQGRLTHQDVDAETLARFLDTQFLPDPDLVIRTSGEARISNFLLWQSAYAEYEFLDTLWPDFTAEEFGQVVGSYGQRERRFGAVLA